MIQILPQADPCSDESKLEKLKKGPHVQVLGSRKASLFLQITDPMVLFMYY